MKFLSIDSPLMQFLSKAADLMLLSLLFVAFSLPILTIGPAATAMYSVFIKRSNGYEGSVIPVFWKGFRENLKNALVIEAIFIPFILVAAGLVYLVSEGVADRSFPLMIVCFTPAMLTVFALSYAFPLTAQFENTPGATVKNAYIMAVGSFPTALAVAGINLLPAILALISREYFFKSLPFFTFIGFSVMGWADEKLLRRVFRKFFPKEPDGEKTESTENE